MRDFLHEPYAAGTEDTTLIVECDPGTEFYAFRFLNFFFAKAGAGGAELDAVFLERAFAGLVTNRAIERMID